MLNAMNSVNHVSTGDASTEPPLCVDLDGTLVKSDTMLDAVLLLIRQQPRTFLQWPKWLRSGRTGFRKEITHRAVVEVEHLPYNHPLLAFLKKERARGRRIYLAAAADQAYAERIAEHVGLFDGLINSNGSHNLKGANKPRTFQQRFPSGFAYIGNAMSDRTLLPASATPMVANPHRSLQKAMRRDGTMPVRTFTDSKPPAKILLKAIRLHQWAKNVLVFLPAVFAHDLSPRSLAVSLQAFVSLSFCASATYLINDLLDIEADRRHPRKRHRPFAAGDLSPVSGLMIIIGFFAVSLLLALLVPFAFLVLRGPLGGHSLLGAPYQFLMWLTIYTAATLFYSFYLKRIALADVVALSGLYTVRILAGSAATGVGVSAWLGAFSVFFFLSLAYVKRFSELNLLHSKGETNASGRGYRIYDMEQLRSFGTGSAFASVVVLTMYVSNLDATHLYRHTGRLWLLVPVLILWISRVWLLASRGHLHDDPVVYAITDHRSWLLGAIGAVIVWSAL